MNCALQDDSSMDEHGVAAALLPLSTAFCRKLCTGVIQFAYTCIQEHSVWVNQQFWEAAFYQDVQREIKGLYIPSHNSFRRPNTSPESLNKLENSWQDKRNSSFIAQTEITALEIAAEQMRLSSSFDKYKLRELDEQEESMLYSQAIHFANRMVYLRVPIDINCTTHNKKIANDRDNISNSITNSVAESDSMDAESGFEDQEQNDREQSVIKFVSRFVDKVCTEGYVTDEHIKALHQMIPGVVAMHVEMLDAVYKESKRLPPIQKPKIPLPSLVPGEEMLFEGLRVYLSRDGREEGLGLQLGGPCFIPAEGALFLTNYRLIFKGQPQDPLACEQVVTRSMPVASITREKRVSGTQHPGPINMEQWMNDGLQVRSNTFQLIRVTFDEEVSMESVESMRKLINRLRHPQNIQALFAFTGHHHIPQTPSRREKDKPGYGTLRGFAKKTLMKTAKAAGLKSGKGNKRTKYVFPSSKFNTSPGQMSLSHLAISSEDMHQENDDLSIVDELEISLAGVGNGNPMGGLLSPREIDGKTLEKLSERSYYKDYQRLGLGTLSTSSSSSNRASREFKVTACNSNYQLCRSYPALVSVPSNLLDENLHRLARLYHQNRLPVITWRHQRTRGLLLRGAGLHSKGVMSMLKAPPTTSGTVSENSHCPEQEKFLSAIVNATPMLGRDLSSLKLSDSSISIDSLVQSGYAGGHLQSINMDYTASTLHHLAPHQQYPGTLTPESNRKSTVPTMGGSNAFSKAMNTLRLTSSTRIGLDMSESTSGDSIHPSCKASLYVLGERAQLKGMKGEAFPKTEFIPVEYPDVRHVKSSFKKLMRACVPSALAAEQEQLFFRAIESSDWMQQLSTILQCSGNIVNLINMLGASVMLALEDGWDFTAQVCSLAQLCLDPFYRTIEGFRVLVEKEWLAFGHRFLHRSNLLQGSQASGFAPFFLQFLDVVHQIQRQFPLSFEFNEYYVRFIAYHSTSGRFRTFLSDCELERAELGIMTEEDKRGSLSRHHKGLEASQDDDIYPGGGRLGSPGATTYLGQSVFDYIEKVASRSPVFNNFIYVAEQSHETEVLRPMYEISALTLWSFLVGEELRHGPSYDPEVRTLDKQQEEEAEAADGTTKNSQRKIVINGYDCMLTSHQDVFTSLLEELRHLELELGHLPQKWNMHYDKLEIPPLEQLNRQVSMTTQMVRQHGRTIYKRSTLELLIRAKAIGGVSGNTGGGESPQGCYSHPHRFEKYNYTTPSYCDHCSSVLWGPLKTGMRCLDCGNNCHEKCIDQVPKNCTRYKSTREVPGNGQNSTKTTNPETGSVGSGVTSLQNASQQYYRQFSSNVPENRTHEAYLWKRGVLLKNWKQRWFVLDTMKHQLRYYDSMDDSNSKGIIELSDVVSVLQSGPSPGAPKKLEDKAFFDLQTKRRLYNFGAADGVSAQEWIEKIQSCLQ